jgi:diacylglycerol kinase family enzyme
MSDPASSAAQPPNTLTPHERIGSIILLVNPASGGVGPRAAAEAEALLADYGCDSRVIALEGGSIDRQIDEALAAKPDLIIVLAGDGTARAVAARAGPNGPLIAPLPGGTMNMLPRALYGTADWKEALALCLGEGVAQPVSGGEVEGEAFYCAAILGAPALWAPAREAIREWKPGLAFSYAKRAWRRAFSGRIRFSLDGQPRQKAEALVLISPMISRAMDEPVGLEAAVMDPSDAADAFRLAATAVFSDWRADPSVTTQPTRDVRLSARSRIPAVIDGEPVMLPPQARVRFLPKAFRALAPRPPEGADTI